MTAALIRQAASGDQVLVMLDRLQQVGAGRAAVWAHYRGGLPTDVWLGDTYRVHGQALNALGLPLISGAFGGPTHWGTDTAQARVDEAVGILGSAEFAAKTDKVVLLGISMGALLALNWARANPAKVACLALMYPVTDLAYMHDTAALGFTAEIEAAYGGAAGYQAALATHNPQANAAAYEGMPIKMWYSDADASVGDTPAAFAAAVDTVEPRVLPGAVHTDLSVIPTAEVQAFVSAHV